MGEITDAWAFPRVPIPGRPGLSYTGTSPWKLCLHTTQGSFGSALNAYRTGTGPPHVTAEPNVPGRQVQHIGFDMASYALRNTKVPGETNRDNVIQVEIVGYALNDGDEWSREFYVGLAGVLRKILDRVPVPVVFPEKGFDTDEAYGLTGSVRMSHAEWDAFSGILGHQHVPENTHWDPGNIDVNLLSFLLDPQIKESEMAYFEKYEDPEAGKEWIATRKQRGQIVVREFSKPRGDGQKMAGLDIVLNESGGWIAKGIVGRT